MDLLTALGTQHINGMPHHVSWIRSYERVKTSVWLTESATPNIQVIELSKVLIHISYDPVLIVFLEMQTSIDDMFRVVFGDRSHKIHLSS